MLHYEDWGSDKTYPHMSVAWSWAFDTPFKWTKQVASHFGGTRQGMAISWPGHIKDVGGIRTQFHHVIDIVPTHSRSHRHQGARDGQRHQAETDRRREHGLHVRLRPNANAPSKRDTQYFEMVCNRGIYHDGWYCLHHAARGALAPWRQACPPLTTTSGNSTTSPRTTRENNDLAAKNPDKLKEMQALFLTEAAKYQVLPLDNSGPCRAC